MRFALRGLFFLVLLLGGARQGRAVAIMVSGQTTYQTTAPTSADVVNWGPVSSSNAATAWDYVGQVNGASGVYLGNNWVLTAAHVGTGDFTLAGITYSMLAGSAQQLGNTDVVMFQITTSPGLPALTISNNAPSTGTVNSAADTVVLIGYGGAGAKSWGANSVSGINQAVTPTGTSYVTNDFYTLYGTYDMTYGSAPHQVTRTYTNNAQVVGGDSGGGDFIYHAASDTWELAGINEARDTDGDSVLVQLSTYRPTINSLMATTTAPEPATMVFLSFGALAWLRRRR